MKRIAVFCGSHEGDNELFKETATLVGKMLADKGIGLVFGGGKVGLMGAVSEAVLQNGGHATGVIPGFMIEKELANRDVQELIEVESMHERKKVMSELADGFLILPGGIGTMDEFFEIFTWRQLGLHHKPIAILDVELYWAAIWEQLKSMINMDFLDKSQLDYLKRTYKAEEAISFLLD
jgi:hypothetical protein